MDWRKYLKGAANSVSYEDETQAYLDAMDTLPTAAQQGLINDLVVALKDAGVFTKMDGFYILMMHADQPSRVNLVDPTEELAKTSTPTFTANTGWVCSITAYLSHPVNLDSETNYAQNDAHIALYQETETAVNSPSCASIINANEIRTDFNGANQAIVIINGSYAAGLYSHAGGAAYFAASRDNSADYKVYRNTTLLATQTNTSVALTSIPWRVGGVYLSNSSQVSFTHFGAALTATELTDVYNAIDAYRTGVAAL